MHQDIFGPVRSRAGRIDRLQSWLGVHQPCVFGRLAGRRHGAGVRGLRVDVCLVDEADRAAGPAAVTARVADGRRAWKDRACHGLTSGLVIWFVGEDLARLAPGDDLSGVVRDLAGLAFPEFAPVGEDTVYTDGVPLRLTSGEVGVFKASIQLFLTAAHRHANHDRRFPGGVAFVVNAPGHYARAAAQRELFPDAAAAVRFVRRTAERSVGNGGIGHPEGHSTSWAGAPGSGLFGAAYQVDVLVGRGLLTADPPDERWEGLHLDYIADRDVPPDDPDFGWFVPRIVPWADRYTQPWPTRTAYNSAKFNY